MLKPSISDHLLYFCAAIVIKVKLKVFCKKRKKKEYERHFRHSQNYWTLACQMERFPNPLGLSNVSIC